jgi:hypothetical protein
MGDRDIKGKELVERFDAMLLEIVGKITNLVVVEFQDIERYGLRQKQFRWCLAGVRFAKLLD